MYKTSIFYHNIDFKNITKSRKKGISMTHLMIHDGENNGIFYSVDDTIYFITHRYVGMYLLLICIYI